MGGMISGGKPPESFAVDDLTFCDALPEYMELECPICLQIMLNEPCLISCCGHHFCRYCIEKAKNNTNCCPYCKVEDYEVMGDKGLERMIKSLMVKCIEHNKGCQWVGQLSTLAGHVNHGNREGECQYAMTDCKHGCGHRQERNSLDEHETTSCVNRPYKCDYCGYKGSFSNVTSDHFDKCQYYPIPCPNGCDTELVMERRLMNKHVKDDCQLTVLSCDFKDDGCGWSGERRDLISHCFQDCPNHLKFVYKRTLKLEKENTKLHKEVDEMKTLLKKAAGEMRRQAKELEEHTEKINSLETKVRNLQVKSLARTH